MPWKLREITLLTILQGMLPLKKLTVAKPLSWPKGIFPPSYNLEKLAREPLTLGLRKGKTRLDIQQLLV